MPKSNRSTVKPKRSRTAANAANTHSSGDMSGLVEPWGEMPNALDPAVRQMLKRPEVSRLLRGTRHCVLDVRAVESSQKTTSHKAATKLRTRAYDYTHERVSLIEADTATSSTIRVRETAQQPLPSREEFDEAVERLRKTPQFRDATKGRDVQFFRPMPPLGQDTLPDGRTRRVVNVGVTMTAHGGKRAAPVFNTPFDGENRFVGVAIGHMAAPVKKSSKARAAGVAASHFEAAPNRSEQLHERWGVPIADQAPEAGGPATVRVTVRKGSRLIWRFFVTRPRDSTGTCGSGVELRNVDYKGKRVLYRAHVPVLNVQYMDTAQCGPYRDWQNQEGVFQADGRDFAPGFRLCATPAKTALDGDDTGNFNGVAFYVENGELVLVSEMEAGWYRYISMWRFAPDGTIRPRFGFTGVTNDCICQSHHHHCCWRFDFDVSKNTRNSIFEFNDPPLPGNRQDNWHKLKLETTRLRDTSRKWRRSFRSDIDQLAYELVPGHDDGTTDPFGVSDLWVLREHHRPDKTQIEIDDGVEIVGGAGTPNCAVMIQIGQFMNNESIDDQDLVVWYAAHFMHDTHTDDTTHAHGHAMGPDLVPVNWS